MNESMYKRRTQIFFHKGRKKLVLDSNLDGQATCCTSKHSQRALESTIFILQKKKKSGVVLSIKMGNERNRNGH
jgi:hypothetical protein